MNLYKYKTYEQKRSGVADLYGVKTKEINQAVKNNPDKFPYGYIFVLDKYEKAEVVKILTALTN